MALSVVNHFFSYCAIFNDVYQQFKMVVGQKDNIYSSDQSRITLSKDMLSFRYMEFYLKLTHSLLMKNAKLKIRDVSSQIISNVIKCLSISLKKLYHTVAMQCLECSRIGYDLYVGSLIFPQNCKMIPTSKQSQ